MTKSTKDHLLRPPGGSTDGEPISNGLHTPVVCPADDLRGRTFYIFKSSPSVSAFPSAFYLPSARLLVARWHLLWAPRPPVCLILHTCWGRMRGFLIGHARTSCCPYFAHSNSSLPCHALRVILLGALMRAAWQCHNWQQRAAHSLPQCHVLCSLSACSRSEGHRSECSPFTTACSIHILEGISQQPRKYKQEWNILWYRAIPIQQAFLVR